MNLLSYRTLLVTLALGLIGSGQTDFSVQPKTSARGWKLPNVKLFEDLGTGQISAGPRNDVPTNSKRLRPKAACGYILVIKPANPDLDSKMVVPPPKNASRMLILEGLPACSEMK